MGDYALSDITMCEEITRKRTRNTTPRVRVLIENTEYLDPRADWDSTPYSLSRLWSLYHKMQPDASSA